MGATISYDDISFLMSITPVAPREYHLDITDSAFVFQSHILETYRPAFSLGHLIAGFGVLEVMLLGACLLVTCACPNLVGPEFLNFGLAFALMGFGWNFLFVGATKLPVEYRAPAEKAKDDGFNMFIIFGTIAFGTLGRLRCNMPLIGPARISPYCQ